MAKKKQKKNQNKSGFKYPIEIKGIIFIVIAIIGFLGFKANILGTIIKGFAMFLMGSFDFIVLAFLLIFGSYMLVKRENPKYFSSRMIGIYIFLIGLLSLAHLNYINESASFFETMKSTIDEVIKCINTKVSFAGGGVIGAFFISIFDILLGKMGSIIVISVLMLIGVILVSDLSIGDAITNLFSKFKRKEKKSKEDDDEYEYEEEDYDEETGEVIDTKAKRKEEKEKLKLAKAKRLSYIEEDDEEEREEVISKKQEEERKEETPASNKYLNYVLPDLSILDAGDNNSKKKGQAKNEALILDNAKRLDGVLRDFGITAKVKTAHVGPSITQYELEVKSGTKISKIKALSSEIALALAATDVRIQAPIPGKSTVGVELPNKISTGVSFYEMMQELLKENSDNKLRVALGKDIMGQPIFMDINKTPHLLIAGSTGSGKSVLTKTFTGMLEENGRVASGSIDYRGQDLTKLKSHQDWAPIRGAKIATIFQDPMTSLDPIKTIGSQIVEVIVKHQGKSAKEAKKMAIDYMDKVGIPDAEKRFNEYPFQYSGGMRQRIVIAIALACRPDILICDEPTTALDVTIQAQIIDLLKSLKEEYGFSVIFITHDLGVVASIADKVAVMYAGEIIEYATVEEIFYEPCHPYTWSLLSSLPQLADDKGELFSIPGTPPSLYTPVVGDAFALRSDYAMQIDFEEKAPQFQVSDTHWAKTWLLHEDAPKVEKPEVIQNLHEKIRANMGFAHLGDEEEGNA